MTLAASGNTLWPFYFPYGAGQTSMPTAAVALTYDSDTDRLGYVGKSYLSDTLSEVYIRTGTVTTGCILNVNFEGVTNGRPDGTPVQTASVTIADSDDNVWKTATFSTPPTVTYGGNFALTFTVDTAGATPNLQFLRAPTAGVGDDNNNIPILLQDTGAGTWTQILAPLLAFCKFTTAGVKKLPMLSPYDGNWAAVTIDADLSNDEAALKFVLPFKCRIIGMRAYLGNIGAGADFSGSLWDSTGDTDAEALRQTSYDGDTSGATNIDGSVDFLWEPYTATAGATYYAGVRSDTSVALQYFRCTTPSGITDSQLALGVPANVYESTRTWTAGTAGAWTDAANSYPFISLIIDQFDDGAGSGGGGGMVRVIA